MDDVAVDEKLSTSHLSLPTLPSSHQCSTAAPAPPEPARPGAWESAGILGSTNRDADGGGVTLKQIAPERLFAAWQGW